MRLSSAWIGIWLAVLLGLAGEAAAAAAIRAAHRRHLKDQVREMFKHGYDGYMRYAHPADELKSVSCKPSYRDPNVNNYGVNDIHPNASLTLLDVLSSMPMIYPSAYPEALRRVCTEITFDQDVKVQVFEMTIRALGSLLSTYQYLDRLPSDPKAQAKSIPGVGKKKVDVKRYQGRVLEMALDLGERMVPAFQTNTGMPYARVNLRRGVEFGETQDTCAAGAGSLVLEFTLLSRLTGDQRFEQAARKAYMAVWNSRSEHDLIGNGIGVQHGQWLQPGFSGVGAGIDSYYEYGMKAAVLLGEDEYLDVFQDSYAAVQTHVRTSDGFIYRPVHHKALHQSSGSTIDSLAAFLPGLQVLAGDLESAIKGHLVYWNLWRKHSAIPESWDWGERRIEWAGYPGRPEFVESNYYLYTVTKDDFYLRVGERILQDINKRLRTKCGFATLRNVETGEKEDRMESFVLSETLKYLYLLFDEADSSKTPTTHTNAVFTTEGHVLTLPHDLQHLPSPIRRAIRRGEHQTCAPYSPQSLNGLKVGVEGRDDWEYARTLIYGPSPATLDSKDVKVEQKHWSRSAQCIVPEVPKFAFDVVLGPVGQEMDDMPPEDPSPSIDKVYQDGDGQWVITDVTGLKLGVRWRLDGQGYDIVKIGPHRVRTGQEITVVDPSMDGYLPIPQHHTHDGPIEVILRFSTTPRDDPTDTAGQVFLHAVGATATFGHSFHPSSSHPFTIAAPGPVTLLYPADTPQGCSPFTLPASTLTDDSIVLMLDRGGCPFLQKLVHATRAGAKGLIVAGSPAADALGDADQDGLIRPSADGESHQLLREVEKTGLVFIDHRSGDVLRGMFAGSSPDHDVEDEDDAAKGKGVDRIAVELLALDGQTPPAGSDSGTSNKHTRSESSSKGQAREGRVGVGEHAIWNLRIVETPSSV